jgi:tetratricopeptide (TPR) repeat protein
LADLDKALSLPPRPQSDGKLFGNLSTATVQLHRAEPLRQLGRIDEAISAYSIYLDRVRQEPALTPVAPELAAHFERRGDLYNFKGDQAAAIADYSEAIAFNPSNMNVTMVRARLNEAVGNAADALADYRTVAAKVPGSIEARQAIARLGGLQDEQKRATVSADRKTVATGPVRKQDRSDCLESYGGGDSETAIPACTRLLASPAIKNDDRVRVLIMRGTWYLSASQPDPAIADFREAAQQSPTRDALFGLAQAYETKGDFDKAIATISDYISAHRNDADGYHTRANLHASNHDFDKAIADMTAKIRVGKRGAGDYLLRADFWRRKGEPGRAIADFTEAIRIAPRDLSAYELRARTFDEMGDAQKALADFRKALSLDVVTGRSMGIDKQIARLERDIAAGFRPDTLVAKQDAPSASRPVPLVPVNENRVALVIGNSAYRHNAPLVNPRADAETLAATLKRIGFKSVELKLDLGREQLIEALRRFAGDAAQADWAIVYFAGHGLQIGGTNYLIPVDAKLSSDRDVSFEAVAMEHVLNAVDGARKLRLAILDACRDNPFAKAMTRSLATRSIGRGLAAVEPQRSTLVAFAARDGQVALDGTGSNSPYVSALIRHLETPGLEINLLFRKVRDEVLAKTGNDQEPFTYGSLSSEALYFRPVAAAQ